MSNSPCKLPPNLILSDTVTFAGGNLLIDIPDESYENGCRYHIVVTRPIPEATTINAPVYITIGGDTATLYPLTKRNCAQVTACAIRTRTRYTVCVSTTPTGGSFKLLNDLPCAPSNALQSLPAPAPAPAGGENA